MVLKEFFSFSVMSIKFLFYESAWYCDDQLSIESFLFPYYTSEKEVERRSSKITSILLFCVHLVPFSDVVTFLHALNPRFMCDPYRSYVSHASSRSAPPGSPSHRRNLSYRPGPLPPTPRSPSPLPLLWSTSPVRLRLFPRPFPEVNRFHDDVSRPVDRPILPWLLKLTTQLTSYSLTTLQKWTPCLTMYT